MKKYSRRNGWMRMRSCAPGDGSVALSWESESGESLMEPVTESDASEYLRLPENELRWAGWAIVMMGGRGVRLALPATRPAHSSRKLAMGGKTYEYTTTESFDSLTTAYSLSNTFFVEGGMVLKGGEEVLSLLFFLNNEGAFRESGHATREKI